MNYDQPFYVNYDMAKRMGYDKPFYLPPIEPPDGYYGWGYSEPPEDSQPQLRGNMFVYLRADAKALELQTRIVALEDKVQSLLEKSIKQKDRYTKYI